MEFKEFRIGDLFNIYPTKTYKNLQTSLNGKTPVVTNSELNNGISKYSDQEPTEKGGIITFSDTTTSKAIFYQKDDFIGYSHVQGLHSKEINFSQNALLYIVACFRKAASGKFDYATKFTRQNAANLKIQLPVTPSGEIDFDYMEQYIEKIEKQYIEKIALMLKASGLDNYQLTEEEKAVLKEEKEKKEFKIEELWTVDDWVYGKDKKWKTQFDRPTAGSLPVISGQTTNNGVKYYTSDNYSTDEVFEDCLTMTTRGESGRVFYHPGKFLLANNVLVMKMPKYSKNVMLYLGTVIEKVCRSTNYSVYPTKDSLKTKTIFLPVTPTEEIDFDYMEKYISAITKTKIKNVVLEINKKLELYKQTQN